MRYEFKGELALAGLFLETWRFGAAKLKPS
jgi:hypothetical protein